VVASEEHPITLVGGVPREVEKVTMAAIQGWKDCEKVREDLQRQLFERSKREAEQLEAWRLKEKYYEWAMRKEVSCIRESVEKALKTVKMIDRKTGKSVLLKQMLKRIDDYV